jgi:hypothetical protein
MLAPGRCHPSPSDGIPDADFPARPAGAKIARKGGVWGFWIGVFRGLERVAKKRLEPASCLAYKGLGWTAPSGLVTSA